MTASAEPRLISLEPRPIAPWLRLAHLSYIPADHARHVAYLRLLDDFELVFQVEDSCWIWSGPDGGSVDIRAGEMAFIPPNFLHGWANEGGRHLAVHFDLHAQPEMAAMKNISGTQEVVQRKPLGHMPRFILREPFTEADAPPLVLPLVTKLRAPGLWRERLQPLVELYSRRATRSLSAMLRASETLGWALRTLAEDAAQAGLVQPDRADARILELVRTLDLPGGAGLGERPSVEDLAEAAGMGLTAFRAAFLKAMGRGPRQYLEERRVEHAARALAETDRKILEIAEAEGYGDPYHFSRVFRRVMGASPRAFRARMRGLTSSGTRP
ncbi:MAG: helix-turn-helix domain-containing protein [Planctomycetota bacterium]|nr:helix-turn-helix domain-containing protein [Planctomycetota bacterium]